MKQISRFLSADGTQTAIELLNETENLTIYAGAGLSIDKTGMSWKAITRELLKGFFNNEESVEEILKLGGDAYVASLADGMYTSPERKRTLNFKPDSLITNLQRALYGQPRWSQGELTESLAIFISSRLERSLSTTVLTTNYDVFLEEALQGQDVELDAHGTFKRDQASITVKHLHGKISRSNSGSIGYPIVLSEFDYARTRNATCESITSALNADNVLIIGSSLQDAPLIEALLNNQQSIDFASEKKTNKVFALVGESTNENLSQVVNTSVKRAAENRFNSFGITPLTYSYYFEVSQFLYEAARRDSDITDQRFADRMKKWCISRGNLADESEVQVKFHNILKKATCSFHAIAVQNNAVEAEHFSARIETWLAFPKDPPEHPLLLWASSDAIWDHGVTTRNRPITQSAHDYAASQAYRNAKPCLVEVDDLDSRSRWRAHVGVPIRSTLNELPVGVMVLSLTSCLTTIPVERSSFMNAVITGLEAIVENQSSFFEDISDLEALDSECVIALPK